MNNNIGLDSLRVIDAIESAGSFHAAAKKLHKVRSAVSHTVRKLEDDLGVKLYDRNGQRAVLTPTGRKVLEDGRRVLRAVSELQDRARYIDGGWEPEFTIALDHLLPLRMVLPALNEFVRVAPQVRMNVTRETQDGAWDALMWRRADIAIGTGHAGPPAGECRVSMLGELEMIYVVAPQHYLASIETELTQEALTEHRFIATVETARGQQPDAMDISDLTAGLSLVDLRDKLEALRAGLGFGLIPAPLAHSEIAAGRLIELRCIRPTQHLIVQFASRRRAQGKALEWFIEALHESGQAWLGNAFE